MGSIRPGRRFFGHGQQDGVLAPKSGKGNHAHQGQGAEKERPMRYRQTTAQAAELADVDHSAHGVHHAAGGEEQQCLEKCVRNQVEHAGRDADKRARAHGHEHVA